MKKITSKEFTILKRFIRKEMGYIVIPMGYYEQLKKDRDEALNKQTIQVMTRALNKIGYAVISIDRYEEILKDAEVGKQPAEPNLGCATTKELLAEVRARIEMDGKLEYRTIDGEKMYLISSEGKKIRMPGNIEGSENTRQ